MSYLELTALPCASSWARRHAKAALCAWQQSAEIAQTAELLVSELVTNAIRANDPEPDRQLQSERAGGEPISVVLRLLLDRIVIEVSDTSLSPPVPADPSTDAECGRGLLIIDALCKEWGHYFPPSGGKVVYAVLDIMAEGETQ